MTTKEILKKFELVWRLIGNPNTEDFVVLVSTESELYNYIPCHVLDMPVYFVALDYFNVTIAHKSEYSEYCEKFMKEWEILERENNTVEN